MKLARRIKASLSNAKLLLPALAFAGLVIGLGTIRVLGESSSPNGSTCEGICVNLTPSGMVPDELAIKAGSFVQFNAADGKKHNISLGEGAGGSEDHDHAPHAPKHVHTAGLSSGDFEADEAWRARFDTPGTYQLHDHYNPDQNILVVVYEDSEGERPKD